jgi:hypothetical protein
MIIFTMLTGGIIYVSGGRFSTTAAIVQAIFANSILLLAWPPLYWDLGLLLTNGDLNVLQDLSPSDVMYLGLNVLLTGKNAATLGFVLRELMWLSVGLIVAGAILGFGIGAVCKPSDVRRVERDNIFRRGTISGVVLAIVGSVTICCAIISARRLAGVNLNADYILIAGYVFYIVFMLVGGLSVVVNVLIRVMIFKIAAAVRLKRLLDTGTRSILIRRFGDGYRFIHGLEREYFAGLSSGEIRKIANETYKGTEARIGRRL